MEGATDMDMRLSDRAEIMQLLARYCEALDEYDIDGVAEVFTVDYVFDPGPGNGGPRRGRDEIVAAQKIRMARWRRTSHQLGQTRIDFLGDDAARGVTYVTAWHQSWENVTGTARLRYVDEFIRRAGAWRIRRRELVELGVDGFPEGTWNPLARRTPDGRPGQIEKTP